MIYLPKRALFIHIPRTGGNSITSAIASSCAGKGIDIIIGTASLKLNHWGKFQRHGRACILRTFIEEWDDIFKFAIYRPEEERDYHWEKFQTRDWDYCTKGSNREEIGVCKYNLSELNEKWPEICDKCKIPRSDLPYLNKS